MRGEQEIWEKDLRDFLDKGDTTTELTPVSKAFGWVLEGEPRYSVVEVEKIIKKTWGKYADARMFLDGLTDLLKDKKRVQEALK